MTKGIPCKGCGRTDGWTVTTRTEDVDPYLIPTTPDKWQYQIRTCKCGYKEEVEGTRKRIPG